MSRAGFSRTATAMRKRTPGADILRLLAAGDYLVLQDPDDPRRSAVYTVDAEGHRSEEPIADGFKSRGQAEAWIRAQHSIPPPRRGNQEELWEPE